MDPSFHSERALKVHTPLTKKAKADVHSQSMRQIYNNAFISPSPGLEKIINGHEMAEARPFIEEEMKKIPESKPKENMQE